MQTFVNLNVNTLIAEMNRLTKSNGKLKLLVAVLAGCLIGENARRKREVAKLEAEIAKLKKVEGE